MHMSWCGRELEDPLEDPLEDHLEDHLDVHVLQAQAHGL